MLYSFLANRWYGTWGMVLLALLCGLIPGRPAASAVALFHPGVEPNGTPFTAQLGGFGENLVAESYSLRGYTVLDGNIGGRGLDLVAFKRDATGALADVRLVEVKTRTGGIPGGLAKTGRGPQMSEKWIENNLQRLSENASSDNATGRKVVSEIISRLKSDPNAVQSELVNINTASDRMVTSALDAQGEITAEKSSQSVSRLLQQLASRGSTSEIRAAATRNLAQWDRLVAEARSTGAAASDVADMSMADAGADLATAAGTDAVADTASSAVVATELADGVLLDTGPPGWAAMATITVAVFGIHYGSNVFEYGQLSVPARVRLRDLHGIVRDRYLLPERRPTR